MCTPTSPQLSSPRLPGVGSSLTRGEHLSLCISQLRPNVQWWPRWGDFWLGFPRLGFPGALPQCRVVWMWFGAFPGAVGLGRASEKCTISSSSPCMVISINHGELSQAGKGPLAGQPTALSPLVNEGCLGPEV